MIKEKIHLSVLEALGVLYAAKSPNIIIQKPAKGFNADVTVLIFPLLKISKKNMEQTGTELGSKLKESVDFIESFVLVKGFLNIKLTDKYCIDVFKKIRSNEKYGMKSIEKDAKTYLLEYSSPNTNKPLHLGHIRNNLLGHSVAQLLKASGKKVKKIQIINDRGAHICQSMLAWQLFGEGKTPENTGIKGDHFVGNYYIAFANEYKNQQNTLIAQGNSKEFAEKNAPIFLEAQNMLRKWESGDKNVLKLWERMNSWVYSGFDETYRLLGISFDKNYYESQTYLLGKDIVENGLKKGYFYQKEDSSVWVSLKKEGLDEKLLLRKDGTSVYITQDLGTAIQRYEDFSFSNMIYTVASEQDYHFKVLFSILKKMGYKWSENCFHLSYGMVNLPSGKMKSREGTVVDADDLISQMILSAKEISENLGKLEDLDESSKEYLYKSIALAALKYYILKVDAKKTMLFDPKESIDFTGNTGPFIQYTYVRISSMLKKCSAKYEISNEVELDVKEKSLIILLSEFPKIIQSAADSYNPAILASYVYDLAKQYSTYYQDVPVLGAINNEQKNLRLALAQKIAAVIKQSMSLLGCDMPDRM